MLDLQQVLEVFLDRLDRVDFPNDVGCFFGYHHLRRVGVSAQRTRNNRSVNDPQALDTANPEQREKNAQILRQIFVDGGLEEANPGL